MPQRIVSYTVYPGVKIAGGRATPAKMGITFGPSPSLTQTEVICIIKQLTEALFEMATTEPIEKK